MDKASSRPIQGAARGALGSDALPLALHAFRIQATDGHARCGLFQTAHGTIRTPVFAPVGTQGTVKALEPRDLEDAACELLLANAYHLYLRPGHARVAQLGGLHEFMQWRGPILTDSGGFQVFSLAHARQVNEDGVVFRSHIDGQRHVYTPELAMRIQESLGSDIAMVLDECAEPADRAYARQALARTHRWAAACKTSHRLETQALFGIVQGGVFAELRRESIEAIAALDFDGLAIGGLAVGETKEQMYRTLALTCPALPVAKPRYLMGVGAPEDIVEAVHWGVDMFDCVLPTRMARNGGVLHPQGRLNLKNAGHAAAREPIQADCPCYACTRFTRAYLHHLVRRKEITGLRLCTLHNVTFMQRLMQDIRSAIERGRWLAFRQAFQRRFQLSDQAARHRQRALRRQARTPSMSRAGPRGPA